MLNASSYPLMAARLQGCAASNREALKHGPGALTDRGTPLLQLLRYLGSSSLAGHRRNGTDAGPTKNFQLNLIRVANQR